MRHSWFFRSCSNIILRDVVGTGIAGAEGCGTADEVDGCGDCDADKLGVPPLFFAFEGRFDVDGCGAVDAEDGAGDGVGAELLEPMEDRSLGVGG